ncbi:MAG: thiamine-monophosphate kinase [Pirellulales bacterium]
MEAEFYEWLRAHVPSHPRLPLGISDDAALLKQADSGDLVITTDLLSDGVDFRLDRDDARRAGRKALAANLSDLAAMAARPVAATISIALPRECVGGRSSLELAIALYEGLLPLAREFDVAVAGGDTNTHDGPTVISVTAFGETTRRGPLTRSGGQPGDVLLVTGSLGGSLAGHHFDFTPRVREALLLHERYDLHAGMDISDGLSLDLARLARASGCGAVIRGDLVPVSPAARSLTDPLTHALTDGEDFELLLAVPPESAASILNDRPLDCPITRIGELVPEPGLCLADATGARTPLTPQGWQH